MLTVAALGLSGKIFLKLGCSKVEVNGLSILMEALEESNRKGRGIITVSNHVSVWDDPLAWGILPWRSFFNSRTTRWTLGASDILFTNWLFSQFFRNGQVIETVRGKGIHQEALDISIQKLNEGAWIHVFPEGKVNQPRMKISDGLMRFKWGVSHMMLRANVTPVVIPMYLQGFDDIMPEDRRSISKFLPKLGKNVAVTFGSPAGITHEVFGAVSDWKTSQALVGYQPGDANDPEAGVRSRIADILRNSVHKLGDTQS